MNAINKKLIPKPLKFFPIGLCLLFALLANHARAAVTYWDPEGAFAGGTYTAGSLAGNWEDISWSTASGGTTPPVAWVENTAACFAVGAGATNSGTASSTTAFTVQMNANHTVAGIFIGPLNPNSCIVTITGPGIMTIPSGQQGFDLIQSSDSSLGQVIISNVIAGSGIITPEGGSGGQSSLALYGTNTLTGGLQLGYGSASWNGIVFFNNSASLGTGTITVSNVPSASSAAFVLSGANAVTIPNAVTFGQSASINLVGNPAGLTFSGPWNLRGNTATLGSGGSGNLVTISGVISGTGKLTKGLNNGSVLVLTGANTYTGGTTVSSGTLSVSSIADSGASALANSGNVTLAGGTLQYTGASAVTTTRTFTGNSGTTSTIDLPAGNLTLPLLKATSSGNFTVIKTSSGTLTLAGTADNSFLGMSVNAGVVVLNKTSTSTAHAVGSATTVNTGGTLQLGGTGGDQVFDGAGVTVNGGVLDLNGRTETMKTLSLSGAGVSSGALINNTGTASAVTATGGISLPNSASIGGSGNIALTGAISSVGSLTYVGTGILTLNGTNTYTGGTIVSSGTIEIGTNGSVVGNVTNTAGTLQLDNASALGISSTLNLAASPAAGAVNLNYSGTMLINALYFGSTLAPEGIWGAPGSGAANTSPAFTGPGLINVSSVPVVVQAPQSMFTYIGGAAGFSVSAVGVPPLTYQWQLNGTSIPGATSSSYSFTNAQLASAGNYACVVSDSFGSTTSPAAVLTVLNPATSDGYTAVIMADGPLAYYRLDETNGTIAHDVAGGHNGIYTNVALAQPGFSTIDTDTAAGFGPGPDSDVGNIQGISFAATTNAATFSLEAWVKSSSASQVSGAAIIAKGNGGGGEQFDLDVFGGVYRFFVHDSATNVEAAVTATAGPTNGVWQHVVAVYDGVGQTAYIYLNGFLVWSAPASTNGILTSTHPVSIGSRQSGGGAYDDNFKGTIDEVAIYPFALSVTQVQNHYNAQINWLGFAPRVAQQPQPASLTIYAGASATFTLVAGGDLSSMTYQWMFNGTNAIPGANAPSYTVTPAQPSNTGLYSCILSNNFGATNSATASLTVLATNGYESAILSDNPISYWRLDETNGTVAHDWVGGNNGQYVSCTLGLPGYSLTDPDTCIGIGATTNSYVSVANFAPFNFRGYSPFAMEAWVNFTNVTGIQRIFSTYLSGGPAFGYGFGINGANGLRFTTYAVQDFDLTLTNSLVAGVWYHLAAVSDGAGNLAFYVNGQPVGTIAYLTTGGSTGVNAPLVLGRQSAVAGTSTPEQVNGRIDEAVIYNTYLSPDRILAHYNARYGTLAPPVVQAPVVSPATNYVSLSATFQSVAAGQLLSYQWYKGSTLLAGATNSTLTLAGLQLTDAGSYSVLVTNPVGSAHSPATALTVLPIPTNAATLNLTNALVLHLPFDGDYNDISGRANNGTNVGATTFVSPGAIGASALSYSTAAASNSYNYVTLGVVPDLQFGATNDFSVSYWVQEPAGSFFGNLPFFSDLPGSTTATGGAGFAFAPAVLNGNPIGGWMWKIGFVTSPNPFTTFNDNSTINDGNWHHLVHTASRTGVCITYLDGVQVDSQSIAQDGNIDTGLAATIGQDPTGTLAVNASAYIDDLAVWRRVLPPLEVSGIYLAGATNKVSFAPAVVVPTTITIQTLANGQIQLSWPTGTLQSASQVTGPYSDVTGATSPWTVNASAPQAFYRVRQ